MSNLRVSVILEIEKNVVFTDTRGFVPWLRRKIGGSQSKRSEPYVLYTTGVSSVLIKGSANLLSFLTTRSGTGMDGFLYLSYCILPKTGVPDENIVHQSKFVVIIYSLFVLM